MFSRIAPLKREDFSWTRLKRALPFFFMLCFVLLVFAGSSFFIVRSVLQSLEKTEAEQLLDEVLQTISQPFSARKPLASIASHLPEKIDSKLSFLRIVMDQEQLLISGKQGSRLNFSSLASLGPQTTGVWVFLKQERNIQPLSITIASRSLHNGIWLQVGKNSERSEQFYQQICTIFLLFFIGGAFLCAFLALIMVKLSLAPISITKERITKLSGSLQTELLPEKGNGIELDKLYHQINELLQHNRLLVTEMQQALDNVAHDLRTPLTRLRSVAEYSLQEERPEKLREALADCTEEADQVLRMLQVMLSVSEAESGTMRLELVEVSLEKSLKRAVMLYEYVAEEKRIRVTLAVDKSLVVVVDKTRMVQVWANLLDNAIKYGQKDGWVRISSKKEKDEVVVSFTDNGQGISISEQNKIWERLYRGDRSRTEKGLGLGLSYVKAVVEAHGGRVGVTSELHKGACFKIFLPQKQS